MGRSSLELTLIIASVQILKSSFTVIFIASPVALVIASFKLVATESFKTTHAKIPFVNRTIVKLEFSVSVSVVFVKVSLVDISTGESVHTLSVTSIVDKITLVGIAVCIEQGSLAIPSAFLPLALRIEKKEHKRVVRAK